MCKNHIVNNLVEAYLKVHPNKKRDAEEIAEMDAKNKITSDMVRYLSLFLRIKLKHVRNLFVLKQFLLSFQPNSFLGVNKLMMKVLKMSNTLKLHIKKLVFKIL